MTVLITGAGMIGTHVARTLLDQGVGVLLYDPDPPARYIESVVGPDRKLFRVERGDVRDFPRIMDLMLRLGVTRILHTAGIVGPRVDENPSLAFQTNVEGTMNVIEAARIRSLARVVVVSSSFVYSNPDVPYGEGPVRESAVYGVPTSFYAAYKAMAEIMTLAHQRMSSLNAIVVRPGPVYGRGEYAGGAANGRALNDTLIRAIDEPPGTEIPVHLPTAERAYVKDVALAIREAIFVEKPSTRIYNIGAGELLTTDALASAINQAIPGANVVASPSGPADPTILDSSLARAELGYTTEWPVSRAIADYVEELRAIRAC